VKFSGFFKPKNLKFGLFRFLVLKNLKNLGFKTPLDSPAE